MFPAFSFLYIKEGVQFSFYTLFLSFNRNTTHKHNTNISHHYELYVFNTSAMGW